MGTYKDGERRRITRYAASYPFPSPTYTEEAGATSLSVTWQLPSYKQQRSTTMHHNNHATSHSITNDHQDSTAPPHEHERPPMKPTTHEQRGLPTNEGRRLPMETHAHEWKRTPTNKEDRPRVDRMRTKLNAQTTTASTHERTQATTSRGE